MPKNAALELDAKAVDHLIRETDWHLHGDTLTHDVSAMPGCRASSSHLQENVGISSNLGGLVMDHARSDLLHVVDTAGMTRRYTRDQMLDMKTEPMEAWIEALRVARMAVELPDSVTLKA